MMCAFYRNLADRRIFKGLLCPLVLLLLLFSWQEEACARSAFSPRHSGMEPPGGPRPLENMPARSLGLSPDGGRGHTDAYGNRVENRPPPEAKSRKRLREGAYGSSVKEEKSSPLPDPGDTRSSPLWKF